MRGGGFSILLGFLLVNGCTSPEVVIENAAKHAALLAARPVLEKLFAAEAPIAPSNRELYPTVLNLPGKPFDPRKYFDNRVRFSDGTFSPYSKSSRKISIPFRT